MGGTLKNGDGDYLGKVNNGDLISLVLCWFRFIISFVFVVVTGLLLLDCCGCAEWLGDIYLDSAHLPPRN